MLLSERIRGPSLDVIVVEEAAAMLEHKSVPHKIFGKPK